MAVQIFHAEGVGNIDQDFGLPVKFRLVFMRGHFTGGTGDATLTIRQTSRKNNLYNVVIAELEDVGTTTNSDVHYRVHDWVRDSFVFEGGDFVHIGWTNPDSGDMSYGIEVGLEVVE
jgi:hypothetical protein